MRNTGHAVTDETLQPLNVAIRAVIANQTNPSTTWRWINRGIAGSNGDRIRLQVWYVGRTPHTTTKAVLTFVNAVTAARMARMQVAQQSCDADTDARLAAHGLANAQSYDADSDALAAHPLVNTKS